MNSLDFDVWKSLLVEKYQVSGCVVQRHRSESHAELHQFVDRCHVRRAQVDDVLLRRQHHHLPLQLQMTPLGQFDWSIFIHGLSVVSMLLFIKHSPLTFPVSTLLGSSHPYASFSEAKSSLGAQRQRWWSCRCFRNPTEFAGEQFQKYGESESRVGEVHSEYGCWRLIWVLISLFPLTIARFHTEQACKTRR